MYRAESRNPETMARYGHGTPDDWIERTIYTPHSALGVSLMLVIDVALFGVAGLTVWAVQMAWIPVTAAGVINGIGHWWGYRNFEAQDASTNISPWGILIGGEELHNNHHTYPTSAKLSVKPFEFDIGWAYIRALSALGLATVKKTPPRLAFGDARPVADEATLEALIAHRYEVMAGYARQMRAVLQDEVEAMRVRALDATALQAARRWMHRDPDKVPAAVRAQLAQARAALPGVDKMVAMREELRQLWLNTSVSREQLTADLQAWCRRGGGRGVGGGQWCGGAAGVFTPASDRAGLTRLFPGRQEPARSSAQENSPQKSPHQAGFFLRNLTGRTPGWSPATAGRHLSLTSLYSTCLRALGSNFMIDIFSGMVFLFLLVV